MDTKGQGSCEEERRGRGVTIKSKSTVNICTNIDNSTLYNMSHRKSASVSSLKCLYVNARSIMNKLTAFEECVMEYEPDVIGITESWTTQVHLPSEIQLDGYTCYRRDRADDVGTRGGGILLYMRETFCHRERNDISVNNSTEALWCEIIVDVKKKDSVIIGVCYDSPSNNEEQSNIIYNDISNAAKSDCIIMGDFNRRGINWNTLESDGRGQKLLDLSQDLFLTQHIKENTREDAILDLIFSSEPGMIDNVKIREKFGEGYEHSSDHRIVLFDMILQTHMKSDNRMMYDYNKADIPGMIKFMEGVKWEEEFIGKNVEEMWNVFTYNVGDCRESHIPKRKKRRSNKKAVWMDNRAHKAQKKKHKLYDKHKEHPTNDSKDKYKKALNLFTKESKRSKEKFETKLAQNIKHDTKSFFAYVRSKSRTKDKVAPLLDENGKLSTDDKINASLLNNFFSSVFTKENSDYMPAPKQMFHGKDEEMLLAVDVEPQIIEKKLHKLKPNKAAGVDDIHSSMLKELAQQLSLPLSMIFKKSLDEGIVPQDWRLANVVPLYKKGDKSSPGNYRPVSLTSIVCKILESVMKDSIFEHLEQHNLIKGTQHGFLSGRSCLTNLLMYLEVVTKHVDDGLPVDTIYLDFAKAFDKVPHNRLLKKLEAHGISGKVNGWIRSWLTDRKQRVMVNNGTSDWLPVLSGVPQGSVLGPSLFLIYINDIEENLTNGILKFADDTKVTSPVGEVNDCETVQRDLNQLMKWSEEWQMLFNIQKCKVMHLGYNNNSNEYTMNQEVLESTDMEKDLGVTIHKSLKPAIHIGNCVKRANQMLGMIRRTFIYRDKEILLLLYKSIVRPHLEYAVQAWSPNQVGDIRRIEGVQRRFTKLIPELRNLPYEIRLKKINLTTLEVRRIRGDLIEVYKILNGFENIDWKLLFTRAKYDGTRGHSMKLEKKAFRLDIRKYFFTQRVIDYWNALPQTAIDAKNVNEFKGKLEVHLQNIIRGLHKPLAFSLSPIPLLN